MAMNEQFRVTSGELMKCFGNLVCKLKHSSDLRILDMTSELRALLKDDAEFFTAYLNKHGIDTFFNCLKDGAQFYVQCMLWIDKQKQALPVL